MESSDFNNLLNNLGDDEKIVEAAGTEKLCPRDVHRRFKNYYYEISHDKYYTAKMKLDDNVKLKKELRREMEIIQELKDKPMLDDKQRNEVRRIHLIIEDSGIIPDKEKVVFEMISDIEEKLEKLKAFLRE